MDARKEKVGESPKPVFEKAHYNPETGRWEGTWLAWDKVVKRENKEKVIMWNIADCNRLGCPSVSFVDGWCYCGVREEYADECGNFSFKKCDVQSDDEDEDASDE